MFCLNQRTISALPGVVALRAGRNFIGIDLNPEYCEMARRRIGDDAPLFNHSTPDSPMLDLTQGNSETGTVQTATQVRGGV